eukprot:757582-Hanusia_phi.AAC.5
MLGFTVRDLGSDQSLSDHRIIVCIHKHQEVAASAASRHRVPAATLTGLFYFRHTDSAHRRYGGTAAGLAPSPRRRGVPGRPGRGRAVRSSAAAHWALPGTVTVTQCGSAQPRQSSVTHWLSPMATVRYAARSPWHWHAAPPGRAARPH